MGTTVHSFLDKAKAVM